MNIEKRQLARRTFLGQSAAGVGLGLGLGAPAVFAKASTILAANESVTMGIIGSGGRGRNVLRKHRAEGAKFAAVCDIYEPNVARGLKDAGDGAEAIHDYRKMLERSDIDAVLIGTPEHLHAPMLIEAVRAGKDAYCEKPMSHSIEEGARMVKAVRSTDRIVQIGMQRRSSPAVHEAKELLAECGKIYEVQAYWHWLWSAPLSKAPLEGKVDWKAFLGPAPWHEFDPMRYRSWRWFWDYSGGNCTDQGTHLMDVVQWFMGASTPKVASCQGQVREMTGAQTPDVFSAVFDYGDFLATWTLNYNSAMDNGWNIQFLGREGTLWLDNSGARLLQTASKGTTYDRTQKPHLVKEVAKPLSDQEHVQNFLECVKSRKEPNAPVEVGHSAVCGPHLANVAWHHRTQARLNDSATKVYVG